MKLCISFLAMAIFSLGSIGTAMAADGKALYARTCVACHGANGKGALPGMPDLGSRMGQPDDHLVESILNGVRTEGSPIAMPVKGGNPALTAADAKALVTYIRSLFPASNASPVEPHDHSERHKTN